MRCMTDPSVDAMEALGPAAKALEAVQLAQLLALRGLLACDVLLHGLQRRHLVDYGRNRWAAVLVVHEGGRLLCLVECCIRPAAMACAPPTGCTLAAAPLIAHSLLPLPARCRPQV